MKRIFGAFAYGDGPRANCWWDQTCDIPARAALGADATTDVAIIGGGFTGLSAALHLARAGVSATVLEGQRIGWGASGRNGGFCCLGGGMLDDATLERRFGAEGRDEWVKAERGAIDLVDETLRTHAIDVDRHSEGETELAHRPRDMQDLRRKAARLKTRDGIDANLIERDALAANGMNGPFHGALTVKAGFALNPRKYVAGLARAAESAGAVIHDDSMVTGLSRLNGKWMLVANGHRVTADKVIIATNGYSSDDLPRWLADRYMPAQSSVIVTRPLTQAQIDAQGWHSDQMAYDSRNMLHYFRLMPDRRFLFGMRGALLTGARAEAGTMAAVRRHFETMFPAWRDVETPYRWSGMVSIARDQMPFVGPVPGQDGLFAGLCYHGNGVAMGSHAGALLADLVRGAPPARPYPEAMRRPLSRFGLGPWRRLAMPPMYLIRSLADRG